MAKPNLTTVRDAAREKACTTQAIYNALDRGDLTEVRLGSTRLVVLDARYERFRVKTTGGRTHQSYIEKHKGGNDDD